MLFRDCCEKYRQYIDKLLKDGTYRYETHKSLASYLKNMMDWNDKRLIPITYIYQFDKDFCVQFLDEIYINRDNTAFTHDNYLGFLRQFGHWCCQKNFLKTVPTEGLSVLGRGAKKKKGRQSSHTIWTWYMIISRRRTNTSYLPATFYITVSFDRPKWLVLKSGISIWPNRQFISRIPFQRIRKTEQSPYQLRLYTSCLTLIFFITIQLLFIFWRIYSRKKKGLRKNIPRLLG